MRSTRSNHVPESVDGAALDTRGGTEITALNSLFGKEKLVNVKALRRVCAGFVALAAALGASLYAVAEPVQSPDQAVVLRTVHVPRNLAAIAEGPTRVALSWQAPLASDASAITGYGIQFSDDGGANWSMLPSVGRQTTAFLHTVGLGRNASLLYRVFSISEEGAGPAAVVSAATPANAMPRIVDVELATDEGATRWYPPRREIVVAVQFDQAVNVNTQYGTPQVILTMGRPPHRQSGYASDYSGGSGTDRLTFRYPADWNQDIRDIEIGPDALHRNGARITNVHASHSASLAHDPATLEEVDQVDTRSDAVMVMDSPAAATAPAVPEADLQVAQYDPSGSSKFAAMLTAASALVAGTEIVHQLALAEDRRLGQRTGGAQLSGTSGTDAEDTLPLVAVDLGAGVGPRAASTETTPSAPTLFLVQPRGQTRVDLTWTREKDNPDIANYLIEVSADLGSTWTNLLGYDTNGNDIYHPVATGANNNQYTHTGLEPGSIRHYRVKARTTGGLEGPWSTEQEYPRPNYAITAVMVPVPECNSAFWSTEIIVGYHSSNYHGFSKDSGTGSTFGAIKDADFSFEGTTYTVKAAYFYSGSDFYNWVPRYKFNVDPALPADSQGDPLDSLTLYIGQVELPFSILTGSSAQATWHSYGWDSAQYAGTFNYQTDDWVTVCLVDDSPGVTLTLTPDSISENGASSTVTATVANASSSPFTVTVSAEPESPAVDADFTLSTNKTLSFAANATDSTGTVTITANHNDVDTPDKTIQVKGELSSGVDLRAPDDVTLTITDDDDAPELSLQVSPATIAEDGGKATVTVSTGTTTFAESQTISLTFAGTATKGTDYTVSSDTLTLGKGERSVSTTVTATDDSTDEDDETILVAATHDEKHGWKPATDHDCGHTRRRSRYSLGNGKGRRRRDLRGEPERRREHGCGGGELRAG